MFGRFLPRETNFFNFFEEHAALIVKTAEQLLALSNSEDSPESYAAAIAMLEKKGDQVTHRCIESLHKTFITPFERNDIYALITHMDDIIDGIEDIASCFVVYKLDRMTDSGREMVKILYSATQDLQELVAVLRNSGKYLGIRDRFVHIHTLENQVDELSRRAIGKLFDEESDPCSIIKWKEIYENLENSVDCCEHVANIVEGVIIENS